MGSVSGQPFDRELDRPRPGLAGDGFNHPGGIPVREDDRNALIEDGLGQVGELGCREVILG